MENNESKLPSTRTSKIENQPSSFSFLKKRTFWWEKIRGKGWTWLNEEKPDRKEAERRADRKISFSQGCGKEESRRHWVKKRNKAARCAVRRRNYDSWGSTEERWIQPRRRCLYNPIFRSIAVLYAISHLSAPCPLSAFGIIFPLACRAYLVAR